MACKSLPLKELTARSRHRRLTPAEQREALNQPRLRGSTLKCPRSPEVNMGDVEIRRARVAEIDALVRLWMQMMHEHERFNSAVRLAPDASEHYRDYLRIHLLDSHSLIVAAIEEERPIGFALAMRCQNLPMFQPEVFGYLSDMVVDPERRSRGVGQSLFDLVVQWCREQGIACLQLQVYAQNDGGQRFWERQGFHDLLSRQWLEL
jgi:ribosomal protein S18 acetylase RimI-like enzyme